MLQRLKQLASFFLLITLLTRATPCGMAQQDTLGNAPTASRKNAITPRLELNAAKRELSSEYESADQKAHQCAATLIRLKNAGQSESGEFKAAQQELTEAVTAAFKFQQQLQAVRLQLAEQDLVDLKRKQERRAQLANQIIERRVKQLQRPDEDPKWTDPNHSSPTSPTANEQQTSRSQAKDVPPTDPQLKGEWVLVQATESDVMALKPNSRMTISDHRIKLSSSGMNLTMNLHAQPNVTPKRIGLIDEADILLRFSGIYKIEQDVLTIAFDSSNSSARRPTSFLNGHGNVQIWKRLPPLPTFETPQDLLAYFDEAMQLEDPDFDKLTRLLTDEESDRLAGFLIAAAGMTTKMMPLLLMSQQFGEQDDDGLSLATISQLLLFLNNAVAPGTPPECVRAFQDFTASDSNLFSGQTQPSMTNMTAFSEKLRLAGQAVGDSRIFVTQIVSIMEKLSNDSEDKDKKDKPKPDWVVTVDGDKAIAVDQNHSKSENELVDGRLDLVRINGTWKIASMISETNLREFAAITTSGIVGTDEDGNSVPIGSLFQTMGPVETAPPSPLPSVVSVKVPMASNQIDPFRKISASDLDAFIVETTEKSPLTYDDVIGKYVNQRLERHQRITREMLVEIPTKKQICDTLLKDALAGEEIFRRSGFPARTFPQISQDVTDLPYDYAPKRFHSELPDWTQVFVNAVVDRLKKTPLKDWNDDEFRLLWSLEPLVFNNNDDAPYDLQPLRQLFPDSSFFTNGHSLEQTISDRWHSGLMCSVTVRLNPEFLQPLIEHPYDDNSKPIQLLKSMCANQADGHWVGQEQARLAGLLEANPVRSLELLLKGNWTADSSAASQWLYALSTDEQYSASRSSPTESCPPPVDPLLFVEVMSQCAGESPEIDQHILAFFADTHPSYAFVRSLDDLLSSKRSDRDTAIAALTRALRKTKTPALKSAIQKLAPAAAIAAKEEASKQE